MHFRSSSLGRLAAALLPLVFGCDPELEPESAAGHYALALDVVETFGSGPEVDMPSRYEFSVLVDSEGEPRFVEAASGETLEGRIEAGGAGIRIDLAVYLSLVVTSEIACERPGDIVHAYTTFALDVFGDTVSGDGEVYMRYHRTPDCNATVDFALEVSGTRDLLDAGVPVVVSPSLLRGGRSDAIP